MQSQDRQSVAREQQFAQRRGGGGHNSDSSDEDRQQVGGDLPKVDLRQLVNSHSAMETDDSKVDSNKVLKDILGVVINMYAKSEDIEKVKKVSDENTHRITQLEAKVGKPDEIALPLGLAVRNLPLPREGVAELDNVRMALKEINAPGVNVEKDVVKATRVGFKAESVPGAANSNLGTVKVEMRTEESRASIMQSKYHLKSHPLMVMKSLVIQNLKSREEMKAENFNYDILKMVTNSSDFYIGGNGHIRRKEQNNHANTQRSSAPRPPSQHQAPPPPHNQYNIPSLSRNRYQDSPLHNKQYQGCSLPRNQHQFPPPQRYQYPPPPQNEYQELPQPCNQYQKPPKPCNQYQEPPQPYNPYQEAPRPALPPVPGPSYQEQASLLDIESIFTFDPIQPNNPYQAQEAAHVPQPLPAQPGSHHGAQQEHRGPAHGDQTSQ